MSFYLTGQPQWDLEAKVYLIQPPSNPPAGTWDDCVANIVELA